MVHWGTANSRKFSPRNSRLVPKRESFLPRKFSAIQYDHKMVHKVSLNDEPRSRSVGQQPRSPSDHTFGQPDHGLEPHGRYWSHGQRLFRVLANTHYKYVRQDRDRYRMPMNVHFNFACLLAFQCAYATSILYSY